MATPSRTRKKAAKPAVSHHFGGFWTELKLDTLRGYLAAYAKVMKNQKLKTWYLDAFAGTGSRGIESKGDDAGIPGIEIRRSFSGSAEIALQIDPEFDFYRFGDLDPSHCAALAELVAKHGKQGTSRVYPMDGNDFIRTACAKIPWSSGHRAVVFLDPYGAQVEWQTLEALANTRSTDVWILFPLWIVQRLLAHGGVTHDGHAQALTRLFGSEEWRAHFYKPKEPNQSVLFEEIIQHGGVVKDASTIAVGEYFKRRLETIFKAVAPYPRLLVTPQRTPLYFLFFAMGSDSPVARRIALDIARHLLEKDG